MAEQVECLKCGGTQVKTHSTVMDRHSDKPIGVLRNLVGGGVMGLLGGLGLVACVSLVLMPVSSGGPTGGIINLWFVVPLLILGLQVTRRYFTAEREKLFSYRCACGHRWEHWESGWDAEPCPECGQSKVTDRPIRLSPKGDASLTVFGARVLPNRVYFLFLGWIAVLGGLALVGVGVYLVKLSGRHWLSGLLPMFLTLGTGLGLIGWGSGKMAQYFGWNTVILHNRRCAACGHSWAEGTGLSAAQVLPPVRSRPTALKAMVENRDVRQLVDVAKRGGLIAQLKAGKALLEIDDVEGLDSLLNETDLARYYGRAVLRLEAHRRDPRAIEALRRAVSQEPVGLGKLRSAAAAEALDRLGGAQELQNRGRSVAGSPSKTV